MRRRYLKRLLEWKAVKQGKYLDSKPVLSAPMPKLLAPLAHRIASSVVSAPDLRVQVNIVTRQDTSVIDSDDGDEVPKYVFSLLSQLSSQLSSSASILNV